MRLYLAVQPMGSLTSAMKLFMEQSSKRWLARNWQGKLAAAFTNGGGLGTSWLSCSRLICLPQHGMLWSGLPLMPTGRSTKDLNRMSSFQAL